MGFCTWLSSTHQFDMSWAALHLMGSHSHSWQLSSTYDLRLASGCYSDEKGDKSDGRRYNSDVEEDKSYRGGVQHLKKRKEDVDVVEVARAPGVNRRRSAHKTATHISVDLVIVLFRVDVTCHMSHITVTCHNVCCI